MADIVKQKQPETNSGYRALGFGRTDPLVYGTLTTDHPIDLTRWQVANCYMGRAGLINSGGASAKAFQRPTAEGIELLDAVQDVYLDDSVTVA